jgi:hypothetical protein
VNKGVPPKNAKNEFSDFWRFSAVMQAYGGFYFFQIEKNGKKMVLFACLSVKK